MIDGYNRKMISSRLDECWWQVCSSI